MSTYGLQGVRGASAVSLLAPCRSSLCVAYVANHNLIGIARAMWSNSKAGSVQ